MAVIVFPRSIPSAISTRTAYRYQYDIDNGNDYQSSSYDLRLCFCLTWDELLGRVKWIHAHGKSGSYGFKVGGVSCNYK